MFDARYAAHTSNNNGVVLFLDDVFPPDGQQKFAQVAVQQTFIK